MISYFTVTMTEAVDSVALILIHEVVVLRLALFIVPVCLSMYVAIIFSAVVQGSYPHA